MSHFLTKCSCGTIVTQCRCPSTSLKTVTIVENGCDKCHQLEVNAEFEPQHKIWRITDSKGRYVLLDEAQCRHVNILIHNFYHGED